MIYDCGHFINVVCSVAPTPEMCDSLRIVPKDSSCGHDLVYGVPCGISQTGERCLHHNSRLLCVVIIRHTYPLDVPFQISILRSIGRTAKNPVMHYLFVDTNVRESAANVCKGDFMSGVNKLVTSFSIVATSE